MWRAKFKSGPVIDELKMRDGKQVEQSFDIVIKNLDDLETLSIVQGSKIFTVRMSDGRFTCNTSGVGQDFFAFDLNTMSSGKLENIRPIYFVRETVLFGEGQGTQVGTAPTVNFTALGIQANIDGTNIKRYLAILPDGTYCIEDR